MSGGGTINEWVGYECHLVAGKEREIRARYDTAEEAQALVDTAKLVKDGSRWEIWRSVTSVSRVLWWPEPGEKT